MRARGTYLGSTKAAQNLRGKVGPGASRSAGNHVVLSLEDTEAHRDDVPGYVGDEQVVAVQQVVVGNELFKVGAGEDVDLAPCTIEVGSDGRFMAPLGVGKVKGRCSRRWRSRRRGRCEASHGLQLGIAGREGCC